MEGNISLEISTNFENQISEITDFEILPNIVFEVVTTFNYLICGEVLGILGILGNIMNILVFLKQGFKDNINIALLAIAVSDIGSLLTSQMSNVMLSPWVMRLDIPIIPLDFVVTVVVYPHNYFIRVSGFITALAAVERCLCVFALIKVKLIITQEVSLFIVLCIYITLIFNLVPVYYVTSLDWKYFPQSNSTKLAVNFCANCSDIFGFIYFITDLMLPYTTFAIIIISNIILSPTMRKRARNKGQLTNAKLSERELFVKKDMKVIKMVVVVSALFIACLIPQSTINTAIDFYRELGYPGKYQNLMLLCYSTAYLSETVCSSINFVVYYRMSSKFRNVLNSMFQNLGKTNSVRNAVCKTTKK